MDDFPNFSNPATPEPDEHAVADTPAADSLSSAEESPVEQAPTAPSYYPGSHAPQYTQPMQPPVQPPYPPQAAPQYPQPNYPPVQNNAPAYNYYQQQQPGYVPPVYPPAVTPHKAGEGFAITSLILGIASVVFFFVPVFDVIVAIVGLIFGIIARSKNKSGMSLAGIIISAIALGLGLIYSVAIIAFLATSGMELSNEFDFYEEEWTMNIPLFFARLFHR